MTNSKKRLDIGQRSLFDYIEYFEKEIRSDEANLICCLRIKKLITQSIKKSDYSRIQVANRMSEQLGIEITQSQLDAWTAESKTAHRFPLEYLPAFIYATADWSLIVEVCRMCGGQFTKGEEILHAEIGKIKDMQRQLKEREKAIQKMLGQIQK